LEAPSRWMDDNCGPSYALDPRTDELNGRDMNQPANIDALLKGKPSHAAARELIDWAADTRNRIARGDMMVGILTAEEVSKIPDAYRKAAEFGEPDAWLALAWWHANPQFGDPDLEAAEQALRTAVLAQVPNAGLELAKLRWWFKRDTSTANEM